jgi:pilus assembly protein Flp/PilA
MVKHIVRFMREEDGATAVEYGLMVALIAGAIVIAVRLIGTTLNTTFGGVVTNLGS